MQLNQQSTVNILGLAIQIQIEDENLDGQSRQSSRDQTHNTVTDTLYINYININCYISYIYYIKLLYYIIIDLIK